MTRNRAADLQKTFRSLADVVVPPGLETELLVVDNASTDQTPAVIKNSRFETFRFRSVREEKPGKANGCNRALAESSGDVIVFVDDDVRVPSQWLSAMVEPIVAGKASAVAGGVVLAPALVRPWMTPLHRSYLASTEWMRPEAPHSLVGANMAFSRDVLRRVPGFDPELGPGALGFGEEELFASQLLGAGYRIFSCLHVEVEHHFDASRLKRASWLSSAAKRGEVNAYLTYHWQHRGYRLAWARQMALRAQLSSWRLRHGPAFPDEGCAERELWLLYRIAELRFFSKMRNCPRHYQDHGLVRLS